MFCCPSLDFPLSREDLCWWLNLGGSCDLEGWSEHWWLSLSPNAIFFRLILGGAHCWGPSLDLFAAHRLVLLFWLELCLEVEGDWARWESFYLMKTVEQLYLSVLSYTPPIWATAVGAVLLVLTLFLSMFLLFQHLSAYKNPEVLLLLFLVFILIDVLGVLVLL